MRGLGSLIKWQPTQEIKRKANSRQRSNYLGERCIQPTNRKFKQTANKIRREKNIIKETWPDQTLAFYLSFIWRLIVSIQSPEGRPGMSDVSLLSGISGLSFESSSLVFVPCHLDLFILLFFFFLLVVHSPLFLRQL